MGLVYLFDTYYRTCSHKNVRCWRPRQTLCLWKDPVWALAFLRDLQYWAVSCNFVWPVSFGAFCLVSFSLESSGSIMKPSDVQWRILLLFLGAPSSHWDLWEPSNCWLQWNPDQTCGDLHLKNTIPSGSPHPSKSSWVNSRKYIC